MRIGKSTPRLDAQRKVAGLEKYAADYYRDTDAGDFLWAGVRRAGIAHGVVKSIDTAKARAVPGVMAVLTHNDIKGPNRQGVVKQDQPVLADTKVRHAGEAMALVVAETKTALQEALRLIEVTIDPLPGIFSLEEAPTNNAVPVHEENPGGNILREMTVVKGRGEAGIDEAIAAGDLEALGEAVEHSALSMHASMLAARPALRDYVGRTLAVGIRPEDMEQPGPRFDVPEDRRIDDAVLSIRVCGSLGGATAEAVPSLLDAPDGGSGQTVARFLPAVLLQKALAARGAEIIRPTEAGAKGSPAVPAGPEGAGAETVETGRTVGWESSAELVLAIGPAADAG